MKPSTFEYVTPATVAEAVEVLASRGDDAKILAGGQSLVPLLNMRLARPSVLVDINGLASELDYVRRDNGHVAIGALLRQHDLETSPLVREVLPVLTQAIRYVGHVTIRNRGTVGGSLAHADPAAELPAAMLALDAQFEVVGPRGARRTIPAHEFFRSYLTTALAPDELLAEIRVPVPPAGTGYGFEELSRRNGDFALVAVLAVVQIDQAGRCQQAQIGIAGAGPSPLRPRAAEAGLIDQTPSDDVIQAAAVAAAKAVEPDSDVHAPAEYRREMTAVLARRALRAAFDRAQRGTEA